MTPNKTPCDEWRCNPDGTGLKFLIVLRDPLLAADISEAIAQSLPGAEVVAVRGCAEAAALSDPGGAPVLAFVAAAPETFGATPLGLRLAQAGTHVILLGDAAEERGEGTGYRVLHRPFTEARLLATVRAALAEA